MSLPTDIEGLYINVRTQNGLTIGGSISNIMNYYSTFHWMQKCTSFVSNNSYNIQAVTVKQNLTPLGGAAEATSKEVFTKCPSIFNINNSWVLCVGGAQYTDYTNPSNYYGSYGYYNLSTLAFVNQTGSAYTNWTNIYPIIDGFDREHYIMTVSLQARNLAGQLWSGYLKDYRNQVAAYPYVISASVRFYYKANLASTTVTEIQLSWVAPPKGVFTKSDLTFGVSSNGVSNPRFVYQGNLAMAMSSQLLSAPPLSTVIITPQLEEEDRYYSAAIANSGGTPYNPLKFMRGDVDNNQPPFFYYTLDDVVKAANSRGIWWGENLTEVQQNAKGEQTTSEFIHAPQVTAEGALTSNSYSGTEIFNNWNSDPNSRPLGGQSIIYNYNINPNSVVNNTSNYQTLTNTTTNITDPDDPYDPALEISESEYTGVGCFATYYSMNMQEVISLNDELWTNDEDWYMALLEGLRLWGADPMQAVMSLRLYPFDVAIATGSSTGQNAIKFGRVTMNTMAPKLNVNATVILDLGETWINVENLGLYGDFRDYAPYTDVSLYIPFIGIVKIDINNFMNTVMRIKMTVDITTGACTAVIYSGKMPYMYIPGNIAVEIPITLDSMTDIAVTVLGATMGIAAGAALGVGGALAAGAISIPNPGFVKEGIGSGLGTKDALKYGGGNFEGNYEVNNPLPSQSTVNDIASNLMFGTSNMESKGSSSPGTFLTQPLYCYLLISRPNWERPANFDHTYGKICHTSGILSAFSGFTVCRNVDTSGIICTEHEQALIKQALENGVYL